VLTLVSAGADGRIYEIRMRKGDPRYAVAERRRLFPLKGTMVTIRPLLPGIRHLSGEKIQWYLASELRDRIKRTGVRIQVIDRQARTQYTVEPREFTGRLLHQLPPVETPHGKSIWKSIWLMPSPATVSACTGTERGFLTISPSWMPSSVLPGIPVACKGSSNPPLDRHPRHAHRHPSG